MMKSILIYLFFFFFWSCLAKIRVRSEMDYYTNINLSFYKVVKSLGLKITAAGLTMRIMLILRVGLGHTIQEKHHPN